MKVKIINVQKSITNEYDLIYFNYFNKETEYFTIITEKSLMYWRKKLKNQEFNFKKGMEINVFRVPNTNLFRIVEVIY